jgi:hypothetical protein
MKELAECKEEQEDRDVQEDRDAFDQASHLKLGQALEKICAYSGTFGGRSAQLGIF